MVKFVTTNAQTCGIPPEAVTQMKGNHEQTVKAQTQVCCAAAGPAETDRPRPERCARHRRAAAHSIRWRRKAAGSTP